MLLQRLRKPLNQGSVLLAVWVATRSAHPGGLEPPLHIIKHNNDNVIAWPGIRFWKNGLSATMFESFDECLPIVKEIIAE